MIKTFIILVLAVLLCGGAYLSRPSEADFQAYIRRQLESRTNNPIARWIADGRIDSYLSGCTYKDRYLWVTVEQGGQTRYIGAFANFWPVNQPVGDKSHRDSSRETRVVKERRPSMPWD